MNTPFHLDQAISRWRAELNESGSMDSPDLAELETHLRDSFEELRTHALPDDEAFHIACRRLGGAEIVEEFAKVDPDALWAERARWMILGIISSLVFWSGAKIATAFALIMMAKFTGGFAWSGAAMVWSQCLVALSTMGLLAYVLVRLTRGKWRLGTTKKFAFLRYPVVLGTLACVLIPLQTLSTSLEFRFVGIDVYSHVFEVRQYTGLVVALVTPMILVAALGMAQRRVRQIS